MDAVGSAIRVDTRGREVVRILPRNNDAVNEEWISDKTRHVADGLRTQRLDRPYVRKNGRLEPASWDEALALVAAKLKAMPSRSGSAPSPATWRAPRRCSRSRTCWRGSARSNIDCRQDGAKLDPTLGRAQLSVQHHHRGHRAGRCDPAGRHQSAPRSGRAQRAHPQALAPGRRSPSALIGERADLTYPYEYLGAGPQTLKDVLDGKHSFAGVLREAKRPMVIVGAAAAARADGAAVLAAAAKIALLAGAGQGGGLERLQRAARGGLARGGPRSRLRAGRGRPRRGRHAGGGRQRRARRRLPARRRRDRHAGARQGLRHLPGQPRRCRRRSAPT